MIDCNAINLDWLRQRLSAIAKAEGGEDSTARRLRKHLEQDGLASLSDAELELALELIGQEELISAAT